MAIRNVIDVDVNTEKFDAYLAKYKEYEDALAASGSAWSGITRGTLGAADALDTLSSKTVAMGDAAKNRAMAQGRASELLKRSDTEALTRMGRLAKAGDAIGTTTARTAQAWRSIAADAGKVYRHVDDATKSLSKMAMMRGVLGGLLGAGGGLYGLDRLAQGAAYDRRRAMGSGVPSGDRKAFTTDFARFVGDPDGMLDSISTAKSDATSREYLGLRGAGLGDAEIQNKNAADLSVSLLHQLPGLFPKGANDPLLGANAEARGLTSVIPIDAIKAYLRASPQERAEADRNYPMDRKDMSISDDTLKNWANLNTQLTRAGSEIEKAFIVGLAPLAPEIADLSKGVVKLVGDFAGSKELKEDLDGAVTSISNFEKALSDPNAWWNKLANGLNWVAGKATQTGEANNKSLLDLMPFLNPKNFDAYNGGNIGLHHASMRGRYLTETGKKDPEKRDVKTRGQEKLKAWEGVETGTVGGSGQDGDKASGHTVVDQSIPVEGRALLDTIASGESPAYDVMNGGARFSGYDQHPEPYKGGRAAGRYQFLGSTWTGVQEQTGIKDFSPASQDKGAWYLAKRDYHLRTDRDLDSDLKSGDPATIAEIGRKLSSTWVSLNGSFAGKYSRYLGRDAAPQIATPQVAAQGTAMERGAVGASPFGAVSDRAAFEAEQRRVSGQAQAKDAELIRRYHEQQAATGTVPHASSLPHPASHPASHPWAVLADGRSKDDLFSGQLPKTASDLIQTGRQMLRDAHMGSISAKTKAANDRIFSDDDLAAVKAANTLPDHIRQQRLFDDDRRHREQGKTKPNGLNFDQYHTKRWHDIRIQNETGANVSQIAGPASY